MREVLPEGWLAVGLEAKLEVKLSNHEHKVELIIVVVTIANS
ncbi:hypothetical protein XBFM1_1540008 [Xenorhabdus bovienii str. feltiae Moldova]|uniref:Uncharacterized protein n=1 Tax=Xenorhabdus bovienii str. feltiae Moldova TaxID=1398200 RepID=A0A077NP83_XENBV|nr:hypothetical protein XBFM1_1540008 [Xenorhabdus bovienii str. feltiae Moldova]